MIVVPLVGEQLLERVDLVVAPRPDLLRDDVVDPDDEDVLVVGPVEDRDLALARRPLVDAPQVVVGELDRRRHLERRHGAAHRVERAHHVLDRAVLAGRVDPLEDDQDRVLLLGPEPVLEVGQAVEALLELAAGRRLVAAVGRAGVDVGEADLRAGLDPEELAEGRGSGLRLIGWSSQRGRDRGADRMARPTRSQERPR